jgi:membrane protein implicated in regulation of membrane protease activity
MDLSLPLSAFTVFLAIAAVGFLFLMAALIFGEIFDFFDHDADFDTGGPGILSTRVIAVFVTTFGGVGALGVHYGLSPMAASAVGAGSGAVFGGAIAMLGRFLYNQQSTSEVRAHDLVGQHGRVVVNIPPNGVGQIRCRVGEELVDKIAQSKDGTAIPENTSVQVETVLGETVIVRKL